MTATAVDDWDQDTAPVDDFRRNQWGGPLIMQPDGTRIGYTRSSTAAKTIEDTYNLERWARRNVAYGMAYDSSLVARLIALGGNPAIWQKAEKDAVNAIAVDAEKVAQSHKGADIGTALHHLTHRLDRGETVVAGPYQADLDAYQEAMYRHGLVPDVCYIECRIVNDLLRMAGSADRIVAAFNDDTGFSYRIADIKTGAGIDFGGLGWAAQLAAYAGGQLYDVTTEQRLPTPPIDQTTGYIIHLPAGQGRCDIYEVDLVNGHRAAELANQIRQIRKESKKWITPIAACLPSAGEVGQSPAATPPVVAAGTAPDLASPAGSGAAPLAVSHPFTPDEGDAVDIALIAEMRFHYLELPVEAKAWVNQLTKEGNAAGVPWNPSGLPSQRRYQLGRAIVALAGLRWVIDKKDDVVRGLLEETTAAHQPHQWWTLGHCIGVLDAERATRFAQLVDNYLTPGDAA